MNCDDCNKKIGNTLYMIGEEGKPSYRELCPICWLGKEEGEKQKYQQFDASWTRVKLNNHKKKLKEAAAKKFTMG